MPNVTQSLHTIANIVPSMVPKSATVHLQIHMSDRETFDAIRAEYDAAEPCHYHETDERSAFRSTSFKMNGVRVVMFDAEEAQRDHAVTVVVSS